MERALKERIIGAIVLVAVVVLVVPVFLDGPSTSGTVHSERVPLPGQNPDETQTIVLERNRSNPVPLQEASAADRNQSPSAESSSASRPVLKAAERAPTATAEQSPVTSTPGAAASDESSAAAKTPGVAASNAGSGSPKPAPAAVNVRPATSATGMFAVQLGSFSNKQNAEKLAADLRKQGFAAFLSQLNTGSGELHRVRIGPQKDRQAAEAMAARLKAAGHKGQVVSHP
jgi:DedD protein